MAKNINYYQPVWKKLGGTICSLLVHTAYRNFIYRNKFEVRSTKKLSEMHLVALERWGLSVTGTGWNLPGVVGHCQHYSDHIPENKHWKWDKGNITSPVSIACANILIEAHSRRYIK